MTRALAAILGCGVAFAACTGAPGLGGPAQPVELDAEAVRVFAQRVESFYALLAGRRFNTLDTFNDPALRAYFETSERFFDYYADLSQRLELGHFEKSRPDRVRVREFVFDTPDRARVRVELEGEDGRPLRPDSTEISRVDRWERSGEAWYVAPEKL